VGTEEKEITTAMIMKRKVTFLALCLFIPGGKGGNAAASRNAQNSMETNKRA